ncbi:MULTISPECIES: ABC transporter substrate-binding protein [Brevibacterium]|jgi:iron complex transport system substrate-binding protein|nr:ABC transporter substrate-binding protein [Brevibacterium sp.]
MHTTRRTVHGTAAALAASALVLSACSGSGAAEEDSGAASGEGFPVTVEHAFGETTVEAPPERVASVAWGNHEAALALGVVPVIMEKATWGDDDGNGVLPWVEDKVEEMGAEMPATYDPTDGIDFEAIADAQPDVILAGYSGLTQEEYDTLSKIAPVAAYPDTPWGSTWQDTLRIDGQALGKEAEAEEEISRLEGVIDEKAQAREHLAGAAGAYVYAEPTDLSSISLYTTHDPRVAFLEELGMETPAAVAKRSEETEEFMFSESAETAADSFSDVDVVLTYGGDAEAADLLTGDALLKKIPAVEQGAIAKIPADGPVAAALNPSPLNIESAHMDDALDAVDAAAAQSR